MIGRTAGTRGSVIEAGAAEADRALKVTGRIWTITLRIVGSCGHFVILIRGNY